MRDDYDFSHAKPAKDVPALARIQQENQGKERITIRLSHDVVEQFRATGDGWQTRIDTALQEWLSARGRSAT